MSQLPFKSAIILMTVCVALASCGGRGVIGGGGGPSSGTAPVVLTMTSTPPINVTILSAEVTLTGATLNPGNVALFSGATPIELTRLQTDIAYISTTLVPTGTYTSLTLTFSNPVLTIENDTGSALATGGSNPSCAAGAICTIQSVATNLSTPITLSNFTTSTTAGAGLLVDVNLNNLLSTTLGADFKNGVTVSQFTPAGTGAPLVGAEDMVGHVLSSDTIHSTFSFQSALTTVSLTVDNTTTFLNFPAGTCLTPTIACVQPNQILSVDISIRADGTPVARNVLFEDADSSDIEVEGIITSTGSLQFTMVALAESAPAPGLIIGAPAVVHFTALTPSSVDFTHADNVSVDTTGFTFNINVPTDLVVGQQVMVRRNPVLSSGNLIVADRVRLRSSRVTGVVLSGATTQFNLSGLPSLFTFNSIPQIQVRTSVPTICPGTGTVNTAPSCSLLAFNPQHRFSARGPLFANSGSPVIIASAVFQH